MRRDESRGQLAARSEGVDEVGKSLGSGLGRAQPVLRSELELEALPEQAFSLGRSSLT